MSDEATRLGPEEHRHYTLAHKIIITVFKLKLPDESRRIESAENVAELIAAGDQVATASRLLELNVRHLAKRFAPLAAFDAADLVEVTKSTAISCVHEAIGQAQLKRAKGHSKRDEPVNVLSSYHLFKLIEPKAIACWRSNRLADPYRQYSRRFLQAASAFLYEIAHRLPEYNDELLASELDLIYKTHELINEAINNVRLPRSENGQLDELATYESEYLSSVISKNSTMEVFGLNVDEKLRRQRIDVAYITLKMETLGDPASQEDQVAWAHNIDENVSSDSHRRELARRVDDALAEIIRADLSENEALKGPRQGQGARILITGSAGSGKTTIMNWLAVNAARHSFRDGLRPWNACTPFMVPLRKVFPGDSCPEPGLEDLMQPEDLRVRVPPGWLGLKLSKNVIILLDGLDELSIKQKQSFSFWITRIMDATPSVNVIITSRPEGVDGEWMSTREFTQLALQPMDLADIRRCVDAWFRPLLMLSSRTSEATREKQARLVADIERQNALSELASTPLVCAMLCAFYAYKHGSAPDTRGKLYEEVIKTLIYERERERDRLRSDVESLPEKQKLLLLGSLASYMSDTSATTIRCTAGTVGPQAKQWLRKNDSTAEDIVAPRLRGMKLLAMSPQAAVKALLRSVVFRQVGYGEAHFAHRSIQEYLTGLDYAERGRVPDLIARAASPEWFGVILFAAGRLARKEASELVSGILAAADREALNGRDKSVAGARRSLIMLAAECYVAAAELDEAVADRLDSLIREVFPPASPEEADMVARCGPPVLPLLAKKAGMSDDISGACVRAAASIGTAEALKVIQGYAPGVMGPVIVNEIVNGWQKFDLKTYSDRVLSHVKGGENWVILRTRQAVNSAGALTSMKKARLEAFETSYQLTALSPRTELEQLDFAGNWRLESIHGISNLTGLRRVNLTGAKQLTSIDELGALPSLHELYLGGCSSLTDISALAELTSLKVLVLDECRAVRDFSALAELHNLMTLSVNGCQLTDLGFCAELSRLRRLHALTRPGVTSGGSVAACTNLSRLEIAVASRNAGAVRLPTSGALRRLLVHGPVTVDDLQAIGEHEQLTEVRLFEVQALTDLSMLEPLGDLELLAVVDCSSLANAWDLAGCQGLRELHLSGSGIRDVNFLRGMPQLSRVFLNRCPQLRDVSALFSLPALNYLSIISGSNELRPWPGELQGQTRAGRRVDVVHDPFVPDDEPADEVDSGDEYSYNPDVDFGLFYGDQG
jgi:hypothetical protein